MLSLSGCAPPFAVAKTMTTLEILEAAAEIVHRVLPPTPQYCWPLLSRRLGAEIWVKHENHTPIGAFKIRGGLVCLDDLKRAQPDIAGVSARRPATMGRASLSPRRGLASRR